MTTLYLSNDLTTGLDATGALPGSFYSSSSSTWGVSTNNLLNGHSKSLQCTSATDGQFCVFAGATATTDMDFQYTQKYNGVGTALGAIVRSDSTFTNGYLALLVSVSSTSYGIYFFKKVGGTITGISNNTGVTLAANTAVNYRVQVIGTTLRAKVWPQNTSEPAAWSYSITDSSITTGSYAGFYSQQNSGTSNGTINAATDIVVSNGFANSVTVDQPSTQTASASFTLTGTYQGTAPTAMDYIFNTGTFGTATAMTSFTASGGTWSGTATCTATTGETFVTVQDHNNTTHTSSSAAFTVNVGQSIAITTPSSQITGTPFTISGTYTGTAPSSLNYQVNSGGYTALTGATISGGNWSGSITISSSGTDTITIQESPTTSITATTGSFSVSVTNAIAITTPSGNIIAGQPLVLSGTYTGTVPTGINYEMDGAGYTAISSPTIGGGNWSGSVTAPVFGQHTITVQEANAPAVTATTSSFIVSVAPNNVNFYYSPFNWNVTGGYASSINAGSYFRILFSGTTCTLNFSMTNAATPYSEIWYKIDLGPWTQANIAATVACTIPTQTSGNSDYPYHFLQVVVKSTSETLTRWSSTSQTAVVFTGLTLAASATILATAAVPLNILFYGDSITEGVRTVGESATYDVDRNDAMMSWAFQLGNLLGAEVGVVGFGAQGLSQGGSGSVPAFGSAYNYLNSGVSRSFATAPNLIVIHQGTNDGSNNITSAYTSVLNGLITACPTTPIVCLRPFVNSNQAANIQAAIAACSNPSQCHYFDTTGVFNTAYGSDSINTHPNGPNNLSLIAPALATMLRPVLLSTTKKFLGRFRI